MHGRLREGQRVMAHGAAGAVGSMVTQLAREFGAYVIGTGRAADRQSALDFGANEFVDLDNEALEKVGEFDLVFDLIGGDIGKRSARLVRAGGTLVSIVGPPRRGPSTAWRSTSLSNPIAPKWVRLSSGCGTGDCGQTSALSRSSTMPSALSTQPSDARGRRSFACVPEAAREGNGQEARAGNAGINGFRSKWYFERGQGQGRVAPLGRPFFVSPPG